MTVNVFEDTDAHVCVEMLYSEGGFMFKLWFSDLKQAEDLLSDALHAVREKRGTL